VALTGPDQRWLDGGHQPGREVADIDEGHRLVKAVGDDDPAAGGDALQPRRHPAGVVARPDDQSGAHGQQPIPECGAQDALAGCLGWAVVAAVSFPLGPQRFVFSADGSRGPGAVGVQAADVDVGADAGQAAGCVLGALDGVSGAVDDGAGVQTLKRGREAFG